MTVCFQRHSGICRHGTSGFLLTETLATFTISAFVLLGLVTASSILLRAVDRDVSHVQDVDDVGRTVEAIKRDVSGLTRARWNGDEPQAFVFQGGPNSLFFAHIQRNPDGSSETSVIALREIASGSGPRLMRSEAKLFAKATSFDDLHYSQQRALFGGTARFRFYYLEPVGAKASNGRLQNWPIGRRLPAALVVEVIERETRRLILSARVPIRANADIGCLAQDKAHDPAGAAPPAAPADSSPSATGGAVPTSTASATGANGGTMTESAFCEPSNGGKDSAVDPHGATPPPATAPTGLPL